MARGHKKTHSTSASANAQAALEIERNDFTPNQLEEPEPQDAQSDIMVENLLATVPDLPLPERQEIEHVIPNTATAAGKKVSFIEGQLGRVPLVGQYVGSLLSKPYILPITQKMDTLVEVGLQRASPYVERILATARQAPGIIQAVPGQLYQSAREAPGQMLQSIRATPGHVYQTTIHTATPIAQTLRALPAHAREAATLTAASTVERAKAVSAKVSQNVSEVSGKVLENIKAGPSRALESGKQTLEALKAAPTKISQLSRAFAEKVLENTRAAPSQVYTSAKNSAAHLVESIKALRSKLIGIGLSGTKSLGNAAQPRVHRIVKLVAPRAEAVAKNAHLQSMYQHRFVQGSVEKATPYVSRVAKQPTIFGILNTFKIAVNTAMAWAIPSA